MANYRYKTAEIEAMKKDILIHCECETSPDRNGNKSAWRLRLILEGMAMCCRCSKREEARRYRKLALFERLTTNDMPNWSTEPTQPATPAETPQISTETAEAKNVSAEGEIREIRHISEIVATCRLHDEIGEETEEWKYYQWLASVNHGNYQTIAEKVLIEAWTNIFLAAYRRGKGHVLVMNNRGELVDTIFVAPTSEPIEKLEHLPKPPKSAPQSTQTARMIKCAAPTPKTREIARKRHCRRLGANGFAMLDDAAATLAAINAPQNLAANSPPIGRPQLTPYW